MSSRNNAIKMIVSPLPSNLTEVIGSHEARCPTSVYKMACCRFTGPFRSYATAITHNQHCFQSAGINTVDGIIGSIEVLVQTQRSFVVSRIGIHRPKPAGVGVEV